MPSDHFRSFSLLITLVLFFHCESHTQASYIDQEPPGLEPRVFAPEIVSLSDRYEFGSVFSKDGNEFYFGINVGNRSEILGMRRVNGEWEKPRTIISHPRFGFNDPFLSPDGNRLYYISDLTKGQYDESSDHDIWYSERQGDSWSEPLNAGEAINSEFNEYYMSFTNEGTMYFSSNNTGEDSENRNFDVYSSKHKDGIFQAAERLGPSINTGAYEADVFIAPDESYIIFVSTRHEGKGQGDLYISFKDSDGFWSQAKNMGSPINTSSHELCPYVSSDGKYLFYTSKKDIYWISTKIFDELR